MEEVEEEDRPDSAASKTGKKEQKLTNQINFCERASQTLNNPPRVGWGQTANLILDNTHTLYMTEVTSNIYKNVTYDIGMFTK